MINKFAKYCLTLLSFFFYNKNNLSNLKIKHQILIEKLKIKLKELKLRKKTK